MNEVRYIEVIEEADGQRLDNFLMRELKGVPKSHIYRIIRSGEVRVNKKRARAMTKLLVGDSIRLPPVRQSPEKHHTVSESFEQRLRDCVIYEDETVLVINKPAGIAVHGGSGVSLGVIEALRKIRPENHYLELVHRLDRETSGCLLIAKKRSFLRAIQALFEARQVEKSYWAVLNQAWTGPTQRWVDAPLRKNTLKSGERMVIIDEQGKASRTRFRLIENYATSCLVEVYPETGRTHQIRVHSASIGHSVVGDEKYNLKDELLKIPSIKVRLFLHARAIQFNLNGKQYSFQAELDQPFNEILDFFRDSQH